VSTIIPDIIHGFLEEAVRSGCFKDRVALSLVWCKCDFDFRSYAFVISNHATLGVFHSSDVRQALVSDY
jgi:hypothetical protein